MFGDALVGTVQISLAKPLRAGDPSIHEFSDISRAGVVEMQRRVLDVVRGTLQRSARPVGSCSLRAWPSGVVSGDCLCAEAEGVADDADAR